MRLLPWLLRRHLSSGRLTLTGPDAGTETFGGAAPGPEVGVRVSDPALDWKLLGGPQNAIAEAYMSGRLDVEQGTVRDLVALWRANKPEERNRVDSGWRRALRIARRLAARNTLVRARRNAAAHYDIGNDLYRLFLDEDMQYSCGYFPTGDETLEEAQLAKKRLIAAKLRLRPGQRVLDIGCGWGGMAIYLAQMEDVEVIGVTLAERQLEVARERARNAGLADRVRFELMDYRAVEGTFDRIVSVGMMEHVGTGQLGPYFGTVMHRLAPGGVALIHSIVRMAPPGVTSPFTLKYIFPGGYIPSLSETMVAVERAKLWLLDCEIWRKHYAMTIAAWARRFDANRDAARAMHDERFCRMWELYLAGAESSFLDGRLAVMHLQLGLERDAVPLTRDYLATETARLEARERATKAA